MASPHSFCASQFKPQLKGAALMLLPLLASRMETCMGERDDAACAGMSTDNPPTPASKILMLSLSGRLLAGSSEGMFYFFGRLVGAEPLIKG